MNGEELQKLILQRTSNPLKITHLPTLNTQIGYNSKSIMPYSFSAPNLTNGTARTIVSLSLPCKGVWLLHYEVMLSNPNAQINGDTIANTTISFLALAIVEGINTNVQFVNSAMYVSDSKLKQLIVGDSYQFDGSAIYIADQNLDLSFNIQSNFTGRNLYLFSNQSNLVIPFNLMATRIG